MGMLNVATALRLGNAPGKSNVVRMGRTKVTIDKAPVTDAYVCAFGIDARTPCRRPGHVVEAGIRTGGTALGGLVRTPESGAYVVRRVAQVST
jgi:hypothetical protein